MKRILLFLVFYLVVLQSGMSQTQAQLDAFKASSPLFQSKYYKANVWDVQRSPAYPTANASWSLGGFAAPYDASASSRINWGTSNDRYLQFDLVQSSSGSYTDDVLGSGNKFNIVLKLYESNGTFVKNLCTYGSFMGFGDKGFLFEQDNHYGTFFANDSYVAGGSVTYTPTTGKLTNLSQLSNYKYSPQLIKPTVSVTTFTYNGQQQGVSIATNSAYTITGTTSAVDIGTYTVTISLNDKVNDSWSDGTTDDVVISWTIVQSIGIDKPIVNTTSFTYNGSEQGIGIATSSSYTVTGVASAVNAGTYTATIALNDKINSKWSDGTTDDVVINWSIIKATYDMSAARWDYTSPFTWDGTQKTVSVTGLPAGVTVNSYTGNTATNAGTYTAAALLDYDKDNYNEPAISSLNWTIKVIYLNLNIIKLWDNVLAVSNGGKYDDIRNATFRWYQDGVLLPGSQQYISFEGSIPASSYKVEIVINGDVAVTLDYTQAVQSVTKAYPNPVQTGQSLSVEMGETRPDNEQAEVLSISGFPVKASVQRQASGYRISGLSTGTYLVRVFTPGQTIATLKIFVK
jgi:hypothetical protein